MKNIFINYKFLIVFSLVIGFTACDIEEIPNPNGPTLESLEDGATFADLVLVVNGLESIMRNDLQFYYNTVAIVGREYYDLNATDPRYTGELLGAGAGENFLDNNGFLTTRAFAAGYRTIRNAHLLADAVENTIASLTQEQKNGFLGFSEVVIAYEQLKLVNRQYQNGIRVDVEDPDNLGPFVSYDEALASISARLDNAISLFNNAGSELAYDLSAGYDGFSTPSGMAEFASGLKARVELYRGNNSTALTALEGSFLDLNGDLNTGVYHVFGTSGNDIRNPLFFVPEQDLYMAHPSFVEDAKPGDTRVSKVVDLGMSVIIDDLTGQHQVQIFSSDIDPLPIINNEELILIYAEANIGINNSETVEAINIIRNAYGLGDYMGSLDDAELLEEVLCHRRYSLFGLGHRWIDLRRHDRLDELPLDRPGDQVFVQFPTPVTEGN